MRDLTAIRFHLANDDADTAEELLKTVTEKAPATLLALDGLAQLQARFVQQEAVIGAMPDAAECAPIS